MGYVPGLEGLKAALSGEIDDRHDQWLGSLVGGGKRVSPQFVADCLRIKRSEAKSILQAAESRGLLRQTQDGWFVKGFAE